MPLGLLPLTWGKENFLLAKVKVSFPSEERGGGGGRLKLHCSAHSRSANSSNRTCLSHTAPRSLPQLCQLGGADKIASLF